MFSGTVMRIMEGHELSFYKFLSMLGEEENDCGQAKRDRENHSPQHQGNVSPTSNLKFYPRGGIILSSTDHPLGGKIIRVRSTRRLREACSEHQPALRSMVTATTMLP